MFLCKGSYIVKRMCISLDIPYLCVSCMYKQRRYIARHVWYTSIIFVYHDNENASDVIIRRSIENGKKHGGRIKKGQREA